ncbi:MAG: hypothetical protein JSC188_001072 [Candidatus Tokpelaia sp. JSC188]|nr:MAG: hypothetical protein JSC188_001072 [Candidatus Tokpelaia sp. JSC188]
MRSHSFSGFVIVVISSLMTTSCGRRGYLEPSPTLLIEDRKNEIAEKNRNNRSFILNPLIGYSKPG